MIKAKLKFMALLGALTVVPSAFAGCDLNIELADTHRLLEDVPASILFDATKQELASDLAKGMIKKKAQKMRKELKYLGDSVSKLKDEEVYFLWKLDQELTLKYAPNLLKVKRKELARALAARSPC